MFIALAITDRDWLEPILSPHVMVWKSQNVLIFDLRQTQSYWQAMADEAKVSLSNFLRSYLSGQMPVKSAASASNPWLAVLLLEEMQTRNLSGYIDFSEPIGEAIFRSLKLSSFLSVFEDLIRNFLEQGAFNKASLLKNLAKTRDIRIFFERLGLDKVTDAALQINSSKMQRRFGVFFAKAWQGIRAFSDPASADFFPWKPHVFEEPLKIQTFFEELNFSWDQISAQLRSDCEKMFENSRFKENFYVIRLGWSLVLYDSSPLYIPIMFRHPHNPRHDSPHYRTILHQAYYSFERSRRLDSEIDLCYQGILAWTLSLEDFWTTKLEMPCLFIEEEKQHSELLKLENTLAVDLHEYSLSNNWLPEKSFLVQEDEGVLEDFEGASEIIDLRCLYLKRPLFLCSSVEIPLKTLTIQLLLEKGFSKWWKSDFSQKTNISRLQKSDSQASCEYYRAINQKQESYWVSKEGDKWQVHGIFA